MNVIVATHEPPFALDRPFRWREPRPSDTAAKSGDQMCFSTECTLGFAAGDTNLYRYCGNSPTNATDPSGHVANVVAGAGIGAIFGAGAYLYQYATGGIEEFSLWDMGAYTLGGAAAGGVAGLTFGASLTFAGGLGFGTSFAGTVATTAVAGGMTGVAAGATGGLVTGVGSTMDDAWRGDATWGQVGMAGLSGMGRGAFYGGIAGAVGGAAFPLAASFTTGGVVGGFIAGSTSAMAADFASQWAGIAVGLQSGYDIGQTAFAGIGGGVFGAYAGYKDYSLGGLSRATVQRRTAPGNVAELEVGRYGPLSRRSRGDGLTPDHMPSGAAVRRSEQNALGRRLTRAEARQLYDDGNTIVIRGTTHAQSSRTYLSRNTPARIAGDARNLGYAAQLDTRALQRALIRDGHSRHQVQRAFQRLHAANRADGVYLHALFNDSLLSLASGSVVGATLGLDRGRL